MEAAQPYIRARQQAQHAAMVANRKAANLSHCAIKGCKRSGGKRGICAMHWKQVPYQSKIRLAVDVMLAQVETARKHHRRIARELNAELRRAA